jgi:hypothetical protein
VTWSEDVVRSLSRHASGSGRLPVALTSGSAGEPKRVPYPPRRLRAVRLAFVDMFTRACRAYSIRRRSLYVFGAVATEDASLTSLLLHERRRVPYLGTLQAPYRAHAAPVLRGLVERYGDTAVRLWILALANPGVLYSTNPSTLLVFLEELEQQWRRHVRLVRDYVAAPSAMPPGVSAIARRLQSRDSAARLARLASSRAPLPLIAIAPGVEAYICWTGGDVQPFLDRLDQRLPASRYRRIPMFSMSTETIETTADFDREGAAFVPAARGVCYEFVDVDDKTGAPLMAPTDLVPGRTYAMVVSDGYGLRRYDTGDVFLCRRIVHGLPDLAFLRRRDVTYSFTGEKVTADQLSTVFSRLRRDAVLRPDDVIACVPSHPADETVPHYKVLFAPAPGAGPDEAARSVGQSVDRLLGELNLEYRAKRESRRLGPMQAISMTVAELVTVAARHAVTRPDTQFKLPSLIRRRWEDLQRDSAHTAT